LRKQRQLWAALVAAMAIAAVVAGCGGGGGDTTGGGGDATAAEAGGGGEEPSGGPAPTKAAFIKEADKICSEGEAALTGEITAYVEENGIEAGAEPTEEQALEIAEATVLPNFANQAEEISALTPPEGDEGTIESMVSSLQDGIAELEDDPGKLNESSSSLEAFGEEATEYGLKACGSEGA
jgi:hypothetical protein